VDLLAREESLADAARVAFGLRDVGLRGKLLGSNGAKK